MLSHQACFACLPIDSTHSYFSIQKFLELDECSGSGLVSKPLSTDDPEPYVVVENASASWDLVCA